MVVEGEIHSKLCHLRYESTEVGGRNDTALRVAPKEKSTPKEIAIQVFCLYSCSNP